MTNILEKSMIKRKELTNQHNLTFSIEESCIKEKYLLKVAIPQSEHLYVPTTSNAQISKSINCPKVNIKNFLHDSIQAAELTAERVKVQENKVFIY